MRTDMTHENWVKLYNAEKLGQNAIAKKVGMSSGWVHRRLIDHRLLKEETKKEKISRKQAHHINFDPRDNRFENIFITSPEDHKEITRSALNILKELINHKIVVFDKEKKKYSINEEVINHD